MNSQADLIAARVARHLRSGDVVNLGIGIPTKVADHVPSDTVVFLQTENGILGAGPTPAPGEEDANLINASKLPISQLPGASYFSSSQSFAMIRGGHVSVAVLGALQVDEAGRLANWSLPGQPIFGVGGAMDLLVGAGRVIVAMTHLTRDGDPKLVTGCDYPLSAERRVDVVVTERASFRIGEEGLELIELAPGTTVDWVQTHTTARFSDRRATR